MFNESAGCRAERQSDECRGHLQLDASIARRRRDSAVRLALGICSQWIAVAPHCVIDSLGEHRLSDRSSATRGQTRPGLTSSSSQAGLFGRSVPKTDLWPASVPNLRPARFRPVDATGAYQDLSLDMVRNTRRISTLTPSAGHHWWCGNFAPVTEFLNTAPSGRI